MVGSDSKSKISSYGAVFAAASSISLTLWADSTTVSPTRLGANSPGILTFDLPSAAVTGTYSGSALDTIPKNATRPPKTRFPALSMPPGSRNTGPPLLPGEVLASIRIGCIKGSSGDTHPMIPLRATGSVQ